MVYLSNMMIQSEIIPKLFLLLIARVLLIAGSWEGSRKGAHFVVTYFNDDIPDEEIKSARLGNEQAVNQV